MKEVIYTRIAGRQASHKRYQLPLASSSQKVADHFESNQFSTTRQLRYSADNQREEIDMVLFVNGLPIITMELKNHWTGQNARVHGINQYKNRRITLGYNVPCLANRWILFSLEQKLYDHSY